MHHVVDGRAVYRVLMRSAEVLGVLRPLHGWAAALDADVLKSGHKQIQLQDELPHLFVLPDVDVDLGRTFNYLLDCRGIVS